MKLEDALYQKLLLCAGYYDQYDEWLNIFLYEEDPLSDLVVELSACNDIEKAFDVLCIYTEGKNVDDTVVVEKLRTFLYNKYLSKEFDIKKIFYNLKIFADSSERSDIEPWIPMRELALIGAYSAGVSKETIYETLLAYLESGVNSSEYKAANKKLFKEKEDASGRLAISLKAFDNSSSYIKMPRKELAKLSGNELLIAAFERANAIVHKYDSVEEGLSHLTKNQRICYTAFIYESEVNNGGLHQYFTNSSGETARYLSEALDIIGAKEHKEMYDKFISDNNVNVTDIKALKHLDPDETFDDHDDAFYKLKSIEDHLIEFVQNNIGAF